MMKKIKKWICFAITFCFLFPMGIISASAAVEICPHGLKTFGDYQMNGGVGQYGNYRRYYYIWPGFNQYYQQWIRNGCNDWVNTTFGVGVTTSISIRETSNKSDAMFEFKNEKPPRIQAFAVTQFYIWQEGPFSESEMGTRNWGWCRMVIDCSFMDLFGEANNFENYQKQAVCMHELGHAFGLSHDYSNKYNLMYNYGNLCYARRATQEECKLINHIYG